MHRGTVLVVPVRVLPVDTKNPANGTAPGTGPDRDRYPRPPLLNRFREKAEATGVSAVRTGDDGLLAGVDHVPRWALQFTDFRFIKRDGREGG